MLRFWETRFTQIKPLKRGGGRRYYRPDDVQLLKGIRHLLYDQGFTIKGVQRILKEQGAKHVVAIGESGAIPIAPTPTPVEPAPEMGQGDYLDVDEAQYSPSPAQLTASTAPAGLSEEQRERLYGVLDTLAACKAMLDKARG